MPNIKVADVAETTEDLALPVIVQDKTGAVLSALTTLATAGFVRLCNGTVEALLSAANAAKTTASVVLSIQHLDDAGKVLAAGRDLASALWVKFPMGTPDGKTAVTVGSSSGLVLAANSSRTHALIKADAANTEAITLEIGGTAVVGEGIVLDPGESYQIGPLNWTGAIINGICTSGGQTARVWEA